MYYDTLFLYTAHIKDYPTIALLGLLLHGSACLRQWMGTLLKMGRYYNTTMCHYWDMSVK